MINEQKPGLGDKFTNDDVVTFFQQGQFSSKRKFQGEGLCIINMPTSDLDHKNEVAPFLSNNDLYRIKSIPGADSHWDRIIGMHKGAHCNQDTTSRSGLGILRLEIVADQAAIDWLVRK